MLDGSRERLKIWSIIRKSESRTAAWRIEAPDTVTKGFVQLSRDPVRDMLCHSLDRTPWINVMSIEPDSILLTVSSLDLPDPSACRNFGD
jgi:hypothetical protein